eukprot:GHVR01002843.1.p1 GENE.GHVR01002843.1~~GHVR01002843.1.p1  ORF type:complete len:228 (-),score=-2.73 GHVR01002843.1:291-974(-)
MHYMCGVWFQMGLTFETAIFIIYWARLWPSHRDSCIGNNEEIQCIVRTFLNNIQTHMLGVPIMLVDFFLTRLPFYYSHALIAFFIGVIYLVTSFITTKLRGRPIYPILTYKDYSSVIIVIAALIIIPFCQIFFAYIRTFYIVGIQNNKSRSRCTHESLAKMESFTETQSPLINNNNRVELQCDKCGSSLWRVFTKPTQSVLDKNRRSMDTSSNEIVTDIQSSLTVIV